MGGLAVLVFAAGWMSVADTSRSVRTKLQQIASGEESPSSGPPYVHKDMPRAGDVFIPEGAHATTVYIDTHSTLRDPVLSTVDFIMGGEYAFLARRRNPIRFDVPHELLTKTHQREVLDALKNDPPLFIIGDYFGLFDAETQQYIATNWTRVSFPGGAVLKYNPPAK